MGCSGSDRANRPGHFETKVHGLSLEMEILGAVLKMSVLLGLHSEAFCNL